MSTADINFADPLTPETRKILKDEIVSLAGYNHRHAVTTMTDTDAAVMVTRGWGCIADAMRTLPDRLKTLAGTPVTELHDALDTMCVALADAMSEAEAAAKTDYNPAADIPPELTVADLDGLDDDTLRGLFRIHCTRLEASTKALDTGERIFLTTALFDDHPSWEAFEKALLALPLRMLLRLPDTTADQLRAELATEIEATLAHLKWRRADA